MKIPIYQIDAFSNKVFGGNPAAICPLDEWLSDETLLNIAKENNLAETAFFIHKIDNEFDLRWFTPEIEMDLCGHATLASAFVILNCLDYNLNTIVFHTISGELTVSRDGKLLEMELPSRPPIIAQLPKVIANALSIQPLEVYKARDYVLIYKNEDEVKNLIVNPSKLEQIDLSPGGIITTSEGNKSDFVSRFFTPGAAVFEDPVTGSAHCTLIPFWAERLKKIELHAFQVSERGGELFCKLINNRVKLKGVAIKYLEGTINV